MRIEKAALKLASREQWFELIKVAMANPVVLGTGLYILVHNLNHGSQTPATNPSAPQHVDLMQSIQSYFFGFLSKGVVGAAGGSTLTGFLQGLEYDALEVALLAYIATGGNIVGAGTSLLNVAETLIRPPAAVAAVAP